MGQALGTAARSPDPLAGPGLLLIRVVNSMEMSNVTNPEAERAERRADLDGAFIAACIIWVVFVIALWMGLLRYGFPWTGIVQNILTPIGLLITLIERRKPCNWLYAAGLVATLTGVVVGQFGGN